MTIRSLIDKVQAEKPNTFTDAQIVAFVNEVEGNVSEELRTRRTIYTANTDMDKKLLAPAPYDRLYVSYVKAMIDFANEEYGSYQLNQQQFGLDFEDFSNWVVRTNRAEEDLYIPHRLRNVL